MRARLLTAVALLSAVSAARDTPHGFFVEGSDGVWRSRGGTVPVEVSASGIRIGGTLLELAGGTVDAVQPEHTGVVRRISAASVETGQLASSLRLPAVWPGIDARLGFRDGEWKLDWLVAPGTSPGRIGYRLRGERAHVLDSGDLALGRTVRQWRPVASQAGRTVPVRWRVDRREWVRLEISQYDPALPLDIDPYLVTAAANFGGTGLDVVRAIAADASGAVYLAGYTDSPLMFSLPVRPKKNGTDAFVLKYIPATSQLVWATYLGGSDFDSAAAVAVDASGNVWVTGSSDSSDFPRTNGRLAAGDHDVFVARLDRYGNLLLSTLFGGALADKANAIALTPSGEAWIAGETKSANFPMASAKQAAFGGAQDGLLMRVGADGALLYSTYWGGSGTDTARAVAVDRNFSNEVVIAGSTASPDFPVSSAAQPARAGPVDAFVTRFSPDAGTVRYSTYLGGAEADAAVPETVNAVALDSSGNAWVGGTTASTAFPVLRPVLLAPGGGATDGFVSRFDRAGALTFSSPYGGNGSDEITALTVLSDGTVLAGGKTWSTDLPLPEALAPAGGLMDGSVLRPAPSPVPLLWATYLGGSGADTVEALTAVGSTAYLAGTTDTRFLATASLAGRVDTWIAALSLTTTYPVSITTSGSGASYTVSGAGCDPGVWTGTRSFQWTAGPTCTITPAAETVSGGTRWRSAAAAGVYQAAPWVTTVNLTYATDYLLTRSVTPAGSGSVSAAPSASGDWYPAGTAVQLSATAAPGYMFSSWSGVPASGAAILDRPITAVANFTCTYGLSAASTPVSEAGGSLGVDLFTGSGCTWSATSNAGWISLNNTAARTGSASVGITVAGNTGAARSGTVTVAGQTWTIQQSACSYVLSSTATTASDAAGTASIDLSTAPTCGWSATSNAPWITLSSGSARTGPGPVSVNFAANTGAARTGTVTVAGQTWTIQQSACTYILSSTATSATDAAGSASIDVSTSPTCGWSANSNVPWITLSSGGARTGPGSVSVSFGANSGGVTRTGTVSVAGQTWTIQQSACTFALSATTTSITDTAGVASIDVSTGPTCNWTAGSNSPWISVTSPARTGSGSADVSFSANPGAARTGTVTVAGQTWTLTQAAAGCTVSADLSAVGTIPVAGQAYTVPLALSGPNCSSWSLTPNAPWIELNPITGNASTRQVVVTAYPNFGTVTRTGTLQAGSSTITLTQAGSSLPETTRFLQLAYFGTMGRMPTAAEVASWTAKINAGQTRTDVIVSLFNSDEFNLSSRFIAGLYVGLLNRDPEYGGWRYQRTNLNAGVVNQTNIVGTFINSPEYGLRWGSPTPADFVRLLYRYILLREGTDAEVAWQVGNLGQAGTNEKIGMARNFLNSQEFRIGAGPRLTAFLLFSCVLARDGTEGERTFMADAIRAGVSVAGMITGFLNSPEMADLLR